jgi:hypothetical protein
MDQQYKIDKYNHRADQANWIMDETSIELIEEVIGESGFPYKYQIHLNYRMSDYDWLHDTGDHDDELERYFYFVANAHKSHLQTWCVKHLDWEKPHYHVVVASEKPLSPKILKDLWKFGSPKYQVIKEYKNQALFQAVFGGAQDGGLLKYMYRHHRTTSIRNTHCPRKANACRKGRCPHQ